MIKFNPTLNNKTPPKAHNISFKGKIIDAHAHIGSWTNDKGILDVFTTQRVLDLIEKPFKPMINGVESVEEDRVVYALASNLDCIRTGNDKNPILTERAGNNAILEACKGNEVIKPLAVCQPGVKAEGSGAQVIDKLIETTKETSHRFYGLKFHPESLELPANNPLYDDYLKVAQKHQLPCLFHCGAKNSTLSSPEMIYTLAKRFPNVQIILAHLGAGGKENHDEAIRVLKESIDKADARLYADISWVDCDTSDKKTSIIYAINTLKNTSKGDNTDRLLFGTDAPLGRFGASDGRCIEGVYQKTIGEIKSAIINEFQDRKQADEIIDKIFFKNSHKLFFEKYLAKTKSTIETSAKITGKNKIIATLVALVVAGIGIYFAKKHKDNTQILSMKTNQPSIPKRTNVPAEFRKFIG